MTTFDDNIYTGRNGLTSAASSRSPATYCKIHRFTGGISGTQTGTFPIGTNALDSKLYILLNASATVHDKITVSAGGVDFLVWSAFGSAAGIARQTTTGLATYAPVASACAVVAGAATDELSYSVTLAAGTDSTGSDYMLQLMFSRATVDPLGN
jgi:hypothetical protein